MWWPPSHWKAFFFFFTWHLGLHSYLIFFLPFFLSSQFLSGNSSSFGSKCWRAFLPSFPSLLLGKCLHKNLVTLKFIFFSKLLGLVTCLFDISPWKSSKFLKLNLFKTELLICPTKTVSPKSSPCQIIAALPVSRHRYLKSPHTPFSLTEAHSCLRALYLLSSLPGMPYPKISACLTFSHLSFCLKTSFSIWSSLTIFKMCVSRDGQPRFKWWLCPPLPILTSKLFNISFIHFFDIKLVILLIYKIYEFTCV